MAACALAGEGQDLIARLHRVGQDHERRPALDCQQLRVRTITDHDHVSVGDPAGVWRPSTEPSTGPTAAVLAGQQVTFEHGYHRAHVGGRVLEGGGPARLADVPPGERALGQHAAQRAVIVDQRHELEVRLGHREPGLADRGVLDWRSESRSASRRGRGASRAAGTSAPARRCARAASASARCTPRAVTGRSRCPGRAAFQLGVADRRSDRVRVGLR